MYILLSGTLAVVISAVREVLQSHLLLLYMLDVVYIQRPILWYDYIPTWHLYRCQGKVLSPFFMDDLCHTQPFAFIRGTVYCCYRRINHQTLL